MSTHYKTILGDEKLGNPRSYLGHPKSFSFCISIGELDREGAFSQWDLWKTCCVRGTISFCNNIIKIFPVGESAVWNVQMWWNEQCWRGTILFSAVFH